MCTYAFKQLKKELHIDENFEMEFCVYKKIISNEDAVENI